MTYREYAPPSPLSDTIDRVWTSNGANSAPSSSVSPKPPRRAYNVLPDGAMDIVATISDDGDVQAIWAVGAMTVPFHAPAFCGNFIGVRFLPGAGGVALGVNAHELCDQQVEFRAVHHNENGIREALRVLAMAPHTAVNMSHVARALGIGARPVPAVLRQAVSTFAQRSHISNVETVARHAGVSRQQLARLFARHVGLTPKQFSRVCRVRAALASMNVRNPSWSRLATEWGFVDQSHFIADVRTVTGMTPGQWLADENGRAWVKPVPSFRI